MARPLGVFLSLIVALLPLGAREEKVLCGTHRDGWQEEIQLHRQAERRRAERGQPGRLGLGAAERSAGRDVGDIAVLEDAGDIISRRNPFNLDQRTVTFLPSSPAASRYRFEIGAASYDAEAAFRGRQIAGLDDDDTRLIELPFAFPFFGASYRSVYLNSDGNLTFNEPDVSTSARSLGRVTSGPPRIAPLFRDLDPSRPAATVSVSLEAGRAVVSWVSVPEFSEFGGAPRQTFQVRLYPDGRVQFAYSGVNSRTAVVGIAPGGLRGSTAVVSFLNAGGGEFAGAVVERFTDVEELDIVLAAQKFYETHEDAYDYLVIYNNLGIEASPNAIAYELTVRNNRTGYGDPPVDVGREFGSPRRLQAVLNMGPLSQYPIEPNAVLPARRPAGDTPLTVLGHEAGHLFLAYASIRDPADPRARPMLGRQGAHWNFSFNSEASLLEGNRICDRQVQSCPGPAEAGRFVTVATVEGFSPLDQYLMGLRPPWEVPDTFLVVNSTITNPGRIPQPGVSFNGTRRNISVEEVIAAEGRRTPDHTVAQRRFRFAFILVARPGGANEAQAIEQLDRYRREFEGFLARAAGGRASADTTLRKALHLSAFPAAGVLLGGTAPVRVSLQSPAETDLSVLLASPDGALGLPASVTIRAGTSSAAFAVRGLRAGVGELVASVPGGAWEEAVARLAVLAPSEVRLAVVSGDRQPAVPGVPLREPVVIRLTDANELPYPGVRLAVAVEGGGRIEPAEPVTGEDGLAQLRWMPGQGSNRLRITVAGGAPQVAATVTAIGRPVVSAGGVVNVANYGADLAPGSFAAIFGVNLAGGATASATGLPLPDRLAGVQVFVGGRSARLHYVSDSQINFVVPLEVAPGSVELRVAGPAGSSDPVPLRLAAVAPAVFLLGDGTGAVTVAGVGRSTAERPAAPGEWVEIYATGLGAVRWNPAAGLEETIERPEVTIGGIPAAVYFSGHAPGWTGLYQINVQVPEGLGPGRQPVVLGVAGVISQPAPILLR